MRVAHPKAKSGPAPVASAPGRLTLNTVPWTEVVWNGQKLGETPLIDVPIQPGNVTLQLLNAERGIRTTIEVQILPGETTAKRLRL